jgi:hypothetical protein
LDDTVRTVLLIALGVGLLYLGSYIRRRSLRSRSTRQGPGPDGR